MSKTKKIDGSDTKKKVKNEKVQKKIINDDEKKKKKEKVEENISKIERSEEEKDKIESSKASKEKNKIRDGKKLKREGRDEDDEGQVKSEEKKFTGSDLMNSELGLEDVLLPNSNDSSRNIPTKIDNELDNIFKNTTFTTLKITESSNEEDHPTKNSSTEKHSPNHPSTQSLKSLGNSDPKNNISDKTEDRKSASSSSSNSKKTDSLETSYEKNLEIQRAKKFAEALRQNSKSSGSDSKPGKISGEKKSLRKSESQKNDSDDDEEEEEDEDGEEEDEDEEDDDDDEGSETNLVHETLLKSSQKPSTSKTKKSHDSSETPEQIAARTVFIGNVNVECVKSKASTRALLNHLLNPLNEPQPLAPRSRIESHRFRGLPLAAPIVSTKKVDPDGHSAKRLKAWKEAQRNPDSSFDDPSGGRAGRRGAKPSSSGETSEAQIQELKFLSSSQKRKIGYVTKNLNPEAKSCIAYVVIGHPGDSATDKSSVPSAEELAKEIVSKADGTTFMDHFLRCDISSNKPFSRNGDGSTSASPDESRRTIFVGGLDVNEQEDSIRKAVEERLINEKEGPPEEGGCWVERVRIVRDSSTALAKGFAYVLLRSQEAVEELLALPEGSFKIGKRKVRLEKYVTPAKSLALKRIGRSIGIDEKKSKKRLKNERSKEDGSNKTDRRGWKGERSEPKRPRIDFSKEIEPVYRGPDLSERLSSLSKPERKLIKSKNVDRVERRMLKKQAKLKMNFLSKKLDRKIRDGKGGGVKANRRNVKGSDLKDKKKPIKKSK